MLSLKSGEKLTIRTATDQEMNLIRSDWFRSFRLKGSHPLKVSKEVFEQGMNARIQRLICKCLPVVATLEDVPEEVLGWSCRDMGIVHYVYVKRDYRRQGIGKFLTFGARAYTHFTQKGALLLPEAQYNPYLLEIP